MISLPMHSHATSRPVLVGQIFRLPTFRPIKLFARNIGARLAVDVSRHVEGFLVGDRPAPPPWHVALDKGCGDADPAHLGCNAVGVRPPQRRSRHGSLSIRPMTKRAFLGKYSLPESGIRWPDRTEARCASPRGLTPGWPVLCESYYVVVEVLVCWSDCVY